MKIIHNHNLMNIETDAVFLHNTGHMYGVGCSALSKSASKKINKLKQRTNDKTFIALFSDWEQLEQFKPVISKDYLRVLKQYYPANITALIELDDSRLDYLKIQNKIGIRIPSSKILRSFIEKIGSPILSTSVNVSGEKALISKEEILNKYEHWFDYDFFDESPVDGNASTIINYSSGKLTCIRDGSIPFDEIEEALYNPKILFVCTGNTCRSPMAEYYFKQLIIQNDLSFATESAGFVLSNTPISEGSKKVLEENGIESKHHLSQIVNEKLVRQSYLVLTMTENHKRNLLYEYPQYKQKIVTLKEYVGQIGDVEDPYQQPISEYRKTFVEIKGLIDKTVEKLSSKTNY